MAVAPAEQWVVRDDVRLFPTHRAVNKSDQTLYVVDESKLRAMADECNARGEETPIVIGHTRDGLSEELQPRIAGYASKYRVGWDEKGKPCLYCRFKLHTITKLRTGEVLTADDVMRYFPRRSAEFLPKWGVIDPISLLGATTPMFDLGLVRCQRSSVKRRYSGVNAMDGLAVLEALGAFVEEMKVKMGGGEKEADPTAGPVADSPGLDAPGGDAPQQYSAMASGTNTFTPSDDLEKVRMQRNQQAIVDRRRDEEIDALKTQHAELRLRYQRKEREADLIQLEAEGYDFDRAEELEAVATLADEQYTAYVSRVRKRYQRVPTGEFIKTARVKEGGGKPQATEDQAVRAREIAVATKRPYAAVLGEVMGGTI